MRWRWRFVARRTASCLAAGLALAAMFAAPSQAQSAPRSGLPYYVEFRARASGDIGHSVVVYGRLGPSGQPAERHYASFVPGVDGRKGMIFPINAKVRASYDDIHAPAIASYRRDITAAQYARVELVIRRMKAQERLWHAFFLNCNDLAIAVAEAIGLRRPPGFMPPNLWVELLEMLNEV